MLTCETCGKVLPEGTSFCPNCGMPVEHTDSAAQPDAPNAPAPDTAAPESNPYAMPSGGSAPASGQHSGTELSRNLSARRQLRLWRTAEPAPEPAAAPSPTALLWTAAPAELRAAGKRRLYSAAAAGLSGRLPELSPELSEQQLQRQGNCRITDCP